MSIGSDFFFDLTPKISSSAYSYDTFEYELLPAPKEAEENHSIITHTNSSPILPKSSQMTNNFSNMENRNNLCNININSKISSSSDRFKFTVIKKNKSLKSPLSPSRSHKFSITRIPKDNSSNFTYSSEENEIHSDDDGIYISIDNTKPKNYSEIVNLF